MDLDYFLLLQTIVYLQAAENQSLINQSVAVGPAYTGCSKTGRLWAGWSAVPGRSRTSGSFPQRVEPASIDRRPDSLSRISIGNAGYSAYTTGHNSKSPFLGQLPLGRPDFVVDTASNLENLSVFTRLSWIIDL